MGRQMDTTRVEGKPQGPITTPPLFMNHPVKGY